MLEERVKKVGRKKPRYLRIQVLLAPEEYEEITRRAKQTRQSLSSFLRKSGMKKELKSICDLVAVRELGKINGDLGRAIGLFKLLLLEIEDKEIDSEEVRLIMLSFRRLQIEMSEIMSKILKYNY